jgi:outer membrane receptor protein involved in Fe transport
MIKKGCPMNAVEHVNSPRSFCAAIVVSALLPLVAWAQTVNTSPSAGTTTSASASGVEASPAPDATDTTGALAEVIVHATRRSVSAQDVGLSVATVAGDSLAKLGDVEAQNVVNSIPNATVNYANGNVAFALRGVGSNQYAPNLDPPVATQVDGVYLSKTFMTDLFDFDMDHVEVAYGPQGTLFGRNTTGGTVNFYTREPQAVFATGGYVEYGNYSTTRSEGYVNIPVTDAISTRFSAWDVYQGLVDVPGIGGELTSRGPGFGVSLGAHPMPLYRRNPAVFGGMVVGAAPSFIAPIPFIFQ